MTTGTRLKNTHPIWSAIGKILCNATLWCCIGSSIGWHIGNAGGFRRGVNLTADLVIGLMDKREDAGSISVPDKSKYTDI